MGDAKPIKTPFEQNQKVTSFEYDQRYPPTDEDKLLKDPSVFKRLIGRLLYLTMTRPDISFSVQTLSQHMHNPKQSHLEAALRIVKYIKKSPGLGLLMSSNSSMELIAYCDSDWAACPVSRKSVSGYCVKLGESLISWKTKKQSTVSRS
ncbi:uncharacterized protein LOC116110760 [Pistacia vera]|uniref:uncharacterized protein LOC116110760 n=1 Tax=Pistacia vera TaxID=55513 RepID=UPI001263A512|nr:uncharacterized protein LOC116110760 [Pistacia vera]